MSAPPPPPTTPRTIPRKPELLRFVTLADYVKMDRSKDSSWWDLFATDGTKFFRFCEDESDPHHNRITALKRAEVLIVEDFDLDSTALTEEYATHTPRRFGTGSFATVSFSMRRTPRDFQLHGRTTKYDKWDKVWNFAKFTMKSRCCARCSPSQGTGSSSTVINPTRDGDYHESRGRRRIERNEIRLSTGTKLPGTSLKGWDLTSPPTAVSRGSQTPHREKFR